MAGVHVINTYEVLGTRAPIPCDISRAHGVAMAAMVPGTTLTPLPFRHPELLGHELRIRVTHSGMCHTDPNTTDCKWFDAGYFPCVPGHEIVGVVEKKGESVENFRIGQKVGFGCFRDCCRNCADCDVCREGDDNICPGRILTYSPHFGGFATSFQAPAKWFHKLADEFPGTSAPLFCAGATVFEPLKLYTKPTSRVGVIGIGGLGHLGIQFAAKMGLDVTALSTSDSKKDEALGFGATHFVNMNKEEDWNSVQRKFDLVLITSSVYSISKCCDLLRPKGALSLIGIPDKGFDADLSIAKLCMNSLSLHSNASASSSRTREMVDFATLHNIAPMTETYAFADAQLAFDSLAHGRPHAPRYRNVLETESFFQTFTPAQ
mmetsp:Transcript_701/g.1340  ORF Transcript_701/g.1340 Transcript_701/m.1340 type:complete len:377 (+) Transcript_701:463-1593(+)